jgi:hypothetical protein
MVNRPIKLIHCDKEDFMYLGVKDVKPLSDYKLLLTFENDEKRYFDVSPYLDDWRQLFFPFQRQL